MFNKSLEPPASRQQEILRQVSLLCLIGIGLFGIAFFAPNAAPNPGLFFQPALHTSWRNVLDLPAVWSSIKIILFCIGLFLVIESAGTVLSLLKLKSLAFLVYFLQLVPCVGLLCGSYYLVKSLL
jgi:hypothetical protein